MLRAIGALSSTGPSECATLSSMSVDLRLRRADVEGLRSADLVAKGSAGFDADVAALVSYYSDTSRMRTIARLRELGVGIRDNLRPLEVSLLRYVVDQLAVAYSSAPSRWLLDDLGIRIPHADPVHRTFSEALSTSQYDLMWRHVDRMRALCRQCVVRFYPVDEVRRVEVRVFTPDLVMREPHPAIGSEMSLDRRFALRLSGRNLEYWWKPEDAPDTWHMVWTDERGSMLPDEAQPLASSGFASPYSMLPVGIVYDEYPSGQAWLAPRSHRLAAVEAVNAMANDLWALIRTQAHSTRMFTGVDPRDVPSERGPDVDLVFPAPDASGVDLTPSPKITESLEVLQHTIRMFLISENLPIDGLTPGAQVLTGIALRTQLRGLTERRQALVALAAQDERASYDRFRSVHNLHSGVWQTSQLPPGPVDVELGDLDVPTDAREELEAGSREIALGIASRVDLAMRIRRVGREAAMRIIQQVDADNALVPVPVAPDAATVTQAGPKTSTAPDVVLDGDGAADQRASVMDALRGPQAL